MVNYSSVFAVLEDSVRMRSASHLDIVALLSFATVQVLSRISFFFPRALYGLWLDRKKRKHVNLLYLLSAYLTIGLYGLQSNPFFFSLSRRDTSSSSLYQVLAIAMLW